MIHRYTKDELDRAIALADKGVSWHDIADRFGVSVGSLKVTVCKYRSGQWGGVREKPRAGAQRVVAFLAGTSPREIAAAEGISVAAVCLSLDREGLDSEVRRAVRAGKSLDEAYA